MAHNLGKALSGMAKPGKSAAHPGFKGAAKQIMKKSGVSAESAGAILASSTRGASAAAKKSNPALKRVEG